MPTVVSPSSSVYFTSHVNSLSSYTENINVHVTEIPSLLVLSQSRVLLVRFSLCLSNRLSNYTKKRRYTHPDLFDRVAIHPRYNLPRWSEWIADAPGDSVVRTVRDSVVVRRIPEAAINNLISVPVALAMGGRGYRRESPRSRCSGLL